MLQGLNGASVPATAGPEEALGLGAPDQWRLTACTGLLAFVELPEPLIRSLVPAKYKVIGLDSTQPFPLVHVDLARYECARATSPGGIHDEVAMLAAHVRIERPAAASPSMTDGMHGYLIGLWTDDEDFAAQFHDSGLPAVRANQQTTQMAVPGRSIDWTALDGSNVVLTLRESARGDAAERQATTIWTEADHAWAYERAAAGRGSTTPGWVTGSGSDTMAAAFSIVERVPTRFWELDDVAVLLRPLAGA